MKVNLIGKKGHSGVGVYTEGLLESLEKQEVDINFREEFSILKPRFLNDVLLSSLLLDSDSDVNHFATQDFLAAPIVPRRSRIVVTVHDIFPYLGYSGQVYSWMANRYVKNLEDKADEIIAVSEFTKEQLIQNTSISASRIAVVYQGVDLDLFRPLETEKSGFFLHVGSEIDRKNIEGLIEIFETVKDSRTDAKLVRVGKITRETRAKIENSDLSLGEDVEYITDVSDKELVELYSGAEKLLFPSHAEGFGRPMIESLACGTPVVAYDKKPMSEVLPDSMLVQSGDQDAFVENALSEQRTDCREIAENFTWEKTAREVKKIYEQA